MSLEELVSYGRLRIIHMTNTNSWDGHPPLNLCTIHDHFPTDPPDVLPHWRYEKQPAGQLPRQIELAYGVEHVLDINL